MKTRASDLAKRFAAAGLGIAIALVHSGPIVAGGNLQDGFEVSALKFQLFKPKTVGDLSRSAVLLLAYDGSGVLQMKGGTFALLGEDRMILLGWLDEAGVPAAAMSVSGLRGDLMGRPMVEFAEIKSGTRIFEVQGNRLVPIADARFEDRSVTLKHEGADHGVKYTLYEGPKLSAAASRLVRFFGVVERGRKGRVHIDVDDLYRGTATVDEKGELRIESKGTWSLDLDVVCVKEEVSDRCQP